MNEKKKRLVLGLGIAFILLIGFTMGWHLQDHVGQKTGEETISKETAAEAEKSEKEIPIYFVEMEEGERNYQLNVAKICEVLGWCFRKLELIDEHGIKKNEPCNFDYET